MMNRPGFLLSMWIPFTHSLVCESHPPSTVMELGPATHQLFIGTGGRGKYHDGTIGRDTRLNTPPNT